MGASFLLLVSSLLMLGLPIFIVLSLAVFIALSADGTTPLMLVVQRLFSGIDRFSLMAIPLFILAGNLMTTGGLSRRMLRVAQLIVGPLNGGLATTTVTGSMFFSAISGSSPATVVAVGKLMLPAMLEGGYNHRFSVGLLMSSGAMGIIIPPSIFMIVYGAVAGVSIGALFMAGIGAGLLYGLVFAVYCWVKARRDGLATSEPASLAEFMAALREASWGLAIPVLILGGIYGGIFTPTEAAAVAVAYAAFVGLVVYREMTIVECWQVCVDSAVVTAQIMIILAAASAFSWYLTTSGLTQGLAGTILGVSDNPLVILLMINIVVLIAGMFLDPNSIVIILVPLMLNIAPEAGINLVQLGVILCVNAAIGMYTPPFGLNLFVASSLEGVTYADAVRGSLPFVLLALVVLVVVNLVPGLSLWLPHMVLQGVGS
ncbi:MAG: TRAP transporter large permease [Salinisphaera sp.]|jgi:C4-dicarboxylate transporter DctM subunit|nr:TRAP transporter large permease [Salinisphaera sp.]